MGQENVNSDYIKLLIWVVVIGGLFAYIWRAGHLARLAEYVSETREELRKCSWPSIDELKGSTLLVLVTILLLGIFTVVVDQVVHYLVLAILQF